MYIFLRKLKTKITSASYFKRISYAFTVTIFLFFIYLLFLDRITTVFNVTADTERMRIFTKNENGGRLALYDADIYAGDTLYLKRFNGYILIEKGVSVTVDRVALGPVVMTLEADSANAPAGKLFNITDPAPIWETPANLEIRMEDVNTHPAKGHTTILTIDGYVTLGREIAYEIYGQSTAVLSSGTVDMTGTSRLFSLNFEAGTAELRLGDQIVFEGQPSKAFGFIAINEKPGMQAAYRVAARRARILKPGPKGESNSYTIRATVLDRLLKAEAYQVVSLIFGIVVVGISITSFFLDFKKRIS